MATKVLPKYGSVTECPKCGYSYEEMRRLIDLARSRAGPLEWASTDWYDLIPAAMFRRCMRCRYYWDESPLDKKEAKS